MDLEGQDSLQGCVSLGGSWASLCRLTACRVPRPRSVLLTCWWLPIPPPPWLSSALPVSTGWRVGGQWGARAKRRVTSIRPSPAPGREWELGLQSGQAELALNAAEPWGRHHPSVTAELGWLWEWRLGPHGRICLQAQLEVLWVLAL